MEQTDMKNNIWSKLDRLRKDRNFSGFRDTRLLELIGATLGVEKLDSIFQDTELLSKLTNTYSITAPTYVFKFIEELIKTENKKSILDPWITISSPIFYIQADNILGTCINQTEFETIKSLFKEKSQNIKLGDSLNELSKSTQKFDLVLSFPPFGMRTQHINGEKSPFDFATTLLLKCGEHLAKDGKLIFLVSNSFLMDDKGKEALNKQGFFVDAVFSIPSGAFAPMTNIPSNLIFISKQNKEKTFVAEISQDEITNKTILQNFKNQKEGKAIQLGCFVDFFEFKSLNALISEKEMQELVKRIGYPPILLTKISKSINALKGNNADEVEHLANSIYLPKVGNSPVVASLSELKIKPKNYYQIQLDETKANSIYVANYFNTPVGKKLRESIEVGAVIPQISKSQLSKCVFFLPDLSTQAELIEVDSKIQQFTFRLDELKRNLWKQPKSYKSIAKELKSINQEEKLENWIDKMPFPISSILWLYYATTNDKDKIEHLLNFFEAFSEFMCLLILSCLRSNEYFYKQENYRWTTKKEDFKNWYFRADFGSWNALLADLSKSLRVFMEDSEKRKTCSELFPSSEFLTLMKNSKIFNILDDVRKLRNDWKGHPGITPRDLTYRVTTLEQKLNNIREQISDSFDDMKIISSAKDAQLEEGIWSYTARNLVGAKSPFREIKINTRLGLEKKKLYLKMSEFSEPIELLPFIKYEEQSEAIYFYSKVESENAKWISYHFDKQTELKQPIEDELSRAFDLLKS